jgi:hypothetical protein
VPTKHSSLLVRSVGIEESFIRLTPGQAEKAIKRKKNFKNEEFKANF